MRKKEVRFGIFIRQQRLRPSLTRDALMAVFSSYAGTVGVMCYERLALGW